MTGPVFTDALRRVLAGVPDRVPVARIDRIWLFPPRDLGGRESGLLVLSLFTADTDAADLRELLTLRFEVTAAEKERCISDTLTSQGHAPASLIPHLIEGVLARMKDDREDPVAEEIAGRVDRWTGLVSRVSAATVDPTSQ